MPETSPQKTTASADGVTWVAPAATYYGIGVTADADYQDSAYMDRSPAEAAVTQAGTTVEAQLALGDPSAGGALTLQFKVSGGATVQTVRYGTVQAPLNPAGMPLEYNSIPLYLAATGATPIGTPATARLTTTYVSSTDMPAEVIQLTVNNVTYPVGKPPVSIPLPVGSLVHLAVNTSATLTTPDQKSSLTASLLPTLAPGD